MKRKLVIIALLVAVTAGCALRVPLGRSRPDIAALMSFDDGPLTFARTYDTGQVGPFTIGQSRGVLREHLLIGPLLAEDRVQLASDAPVWRVALPAKSGGYNIYTLNFMDDQLVSVEAFYSIFAGL